MQAVASGGQLTLVTNEERGAAIRRRRLQQGFRSVRQLSGQSGLGREAIRAAEAGTAREDTYQRLEAFLDDWEHEVGEDIPVRPLDPQGRYVEIELYKGNAKAYVKADAGDPEAIRDLVANILAGMSDDDDETPKSSP